MNEETIIGMPPGIGDLHWIMTKMESFKEKNGIKNLKVVMNLDWMTQNNRHCYSIDYLNLIPFVDSAESKEGVMPFEYALAGGSGKPLFENIDGCDYMIEFNSQLEAGVKLKDILPEYDTNFDYPIITHPGPEVWAEGIKQRAGGKIFVIFTASTEGNDIWANKLWGPRDWMEIVQGIYKETGCKPVLVGGKWDLDYARRLCQFDYDKIILNIVGESTVMQLLALLRKASVVVAYQCGVVMMAVQFRVPTVALWSIVNEANPKMKLKRELMRSWVPPWADEVGYMPRGFGDADATPDGVLADIRRYL